MMCATVFGITEHPAPPNVESWTFKGEPMSLPGVPEAREMIPAQRRVRIVEILRERRAVRVSSLSDDLRVSEMTIRRDLERLEAEGLLSRTHGGAILKQHMAEEPHYVDNVATHAKEKKRIARVAAATIQT